MATLAACGGGGGGSAPAPGPVAQTPSPSPAPAPSPSPAPSPAPAPAPATGAPLIGDCEVFPASAIFNTRIDDTARFPAHTQSSAWIASVGASTRFHADWGTTEDPAQASTYWGIPINSITSAQTDWPVVGFDFSPSGVSTDSGWPDESDCAVASGTGFALTRNCAGQAPSQRRFPFPQAQVLKNEGGNCNDPNTCGDHHVLVVEQGSCRLWESYFAYRLSGQWYALSTAAWDLKSLQLRPSTWTSGDAAGLPMTPLLARVSEASAGAVNHALRVTFPDGVLANTFVWPARHAAGSSTPGGIPFGALLRLKADFAIPATWTPQAKALATAMKRYGLYVADIGSRFYVQGEPSAQWDPNTFSQLQLISMADMEFVDTQAITADPRFNVDSMQASW